MVSLEGHRPHPRLGRYPPVRAAATAAASRPLRWSTPNVWSATEAAPEPILQRLHGVLNADCDIPSSAAAGTGVERTLLTVALTNGLPQAASTGSTALRK